MGRKIDDLLASVLMCTFNFLHVYLVAKVHSSA